MARIERFEDIEAWQSARELTKMVCSQLPGPVRARLSIL
jgi:hypothetical protein